MYIPTFNQRKLQRLLLSANAEGISTNKTQSRNKKLKYKQVSRITEKVPGNVNRPTV